MVSLASCTNNQLDVLIECLPNDTVKYEYDSRLGYTVPDSVEGRIRTIQSPFPNYYGFTESYVSEDGDYLDSFVLSDTCCFERNAVVPTVIRKLILMTDSGLEDSKLISSTRDYLVTKIDVDNIVGFLCKYSRDSIVIDSIIDVSDIQTVKKLINEYK